MRLGKGRVTRQEGIYEHNPERHAQGRMTDPLDRSQGIGQLRDFFRLPAGGDDPQAVVMIEMGVLGRDDRLLERVLSVGYPAHDVCLWWS
jgi:hypothetical protein